MSHPPLGVPSTPSPSEWTTWWTPDPLAITALSISVALYTIGAARLWRHAGLGHGLRPWQAVAHGAGITVIAIALISPLDRASDVLFSAHMAQHELLMLIAAPLIVLGRPLAAVAWSLPRSWRVGAARFSRRPAAATVWRVLTAPLVALLLHAGTRWIWHLPSAFDAALADERIHAFQHATFFVTATLFWWSLIHGRYGRMGYGVAAVFVFFTMLHSGLLAALLGLGDHPLYAAHAARTASWGLDPVEDQQRAGLVMWIPAGVIMMGVGLAMFAAWLGQASRVAARSPHPGLRGERDPATGGR
jgi:putative membrane protein